MRLALLLATLAAAGSWDSDPRTPACTVERLFSIEAALPNMIMRRAGEIPSDEGRQAVRFLSEHPNIPMAVAFIEPARAREVRRPTLAAPDILMAYDLDTKRFLFSHRLLHLAGADEQSFIASKKAQREAMDAVAMFFVHETSHARERVSGDAPLTAEDELTAAYRGFLFLLDALDAEPAFDRLRESAGLQAAMASLGERKDPELRASYTEAVTTPRHGELRALARLARSNAAFEAWFLAPYAGSTGSLREPVASEARLQQNRKKTADYLAQARSLGTSDPDEEAALRRLDEDLAFWHDGARVARLREHYAETLGTLRREMDRRRKAGKLSPFAARPEAVDPRWD